MLHHKHEHCRPEPPKREQPPYCGPVNTAGMGEYYSAHACPPPPPAPCGCGYNIPPVKPLFVPGMSTQEQIAILAGKVDEMCNILGEYDKKMWGAYDAIVHSCICNDAYYTEIETEVGYLPATSAKYTVVRIPFVDKSNQPIRLQLGLAYNNTTNSGLHESVFDASERVLADKLFPACNIADEWTGKVYWKGAPLNPEFSDGFTVGVLRNGFIKVYNQTATNADMNKDDVENAMGVAGVLVSGGAKTPDNYGYTEGITGMVALGMNYDTQERFFILVDGEQATGVTSGGGCTADQLAELFVKRGCTVAVLLAYKESVCGLDCGEMLNIPYDVNHIPYVPQLNAFWYITKEDHYHNDYVREVAELMQKYGRTIWQGVINGKTLDAVRAELADLTSQLEQEVQDRKDGDAALGERIDTLGERVTTLYNELVEADTALGKRIDKEIEDRKQAIADEAAAREAADEALRQSDETITGLINQEKAAREAADTQLQQNINNEADERKRTDITILEQLEQEKTDRTNADTAINEALNQLKTDYEAFKTSTTTDLATKTTQINQILADISSVKNLIAGVQATQSEIDETLTSIQNTLATMEKSFENLKQTVADLQTSWEQYKETMNEQYTAFKDTVEKALSDMDKTLRAWVTEQLGNYVPLAGTADGKPATGEIVVRRGTNNSPGFTSRTISSNHETNIYPGKITINSGDGNHNSADITVELGGAEAPTSVKFTDPDRNDELSNVSIANPTQDSHGATKKYVDDKKAVYDKDYYRLTPTAPMSEAWIRTADSDATGAIIEASGNNVLKVRGVHGSTANVRIENVADPVNAQDAVTKKYFEAHTIGEYVPMTGTTQDSPVTGSLVFANTQTYTPNHPGLDGIGSIKFEYGTPAQTTDIPTMEFDFSGEHGRVLTLRDTTPVKTRAAGGNSDIRNKFTFDSKDGFGVNLVVSDGGTVQEPVTTFLSSNGLRCEIATGSWISMQLNAYSREITLGGSTSNVVHDCVISGVAEPVQNNHASNKRYVDDAMFSNDIEVVFTLDSKEVTDEYFVLLGTTTVPAKERYKLVNILLTEESVTSTGSQEISNPVLLTNIHVTKSATSEDREVSIYGMLQHDVAGITPVVLTKFSASLTLLYKRT